MRKVSENTLISRIGRRLARSGEYLRCSHDDGTYNELGYYFIVNQNNVVERQHIDIESLARELGAMSEDEEMAAA